MSGRVGAAALCVLVAGLSGGPVLGAETSVPPPGKTDTFEHDTWMRRHRYPLKVDLIAFEGRGALNVPVTMAVACGEGDYPKGRLCPVLSGVRLAAQVDVLATWPTDGSIRHALVSVVLPRIGPKQALALTFERDVPPAPGPFQPAVSLKDLVVRAEFDNVDGTKTISAISPAVLARMAEVMRGGAEPGDLAPRLAGPVCYEFEVHDVPRTAGAADPDIDVFYRLRLYSGRRGVRIAYVVENTRMPAKPYPAEFAVSDRDFTRLAFLAGPAEAPKVVYEHGPVTHWYQTRYRALGWWGDRPPPVYAKQSFPYLVYAQFFPKLDIEHPLTAAQVAAACRGKWFKEDDDPIKFPDGRILSSGPVYRHMPGTGGRPDIGPYATWHRLALASNSPRLDRYARAADGNGLAAFPIHRREGGTLAPGAPYEDPIHPRYWYADRGRGTGLQRRPGQRKCPYKPDQAHTPSAAFYSYLTTGDRFFEEELAFWAMYPSTNWPFKGLLPFGQARAGAWQLRNVTDAAFLLPDRHPRKSYLIGYLDRNLAHVAAVLKQRGHLMYGKRKVSGRQDWVCAHQGSVWQYAWLVWSLDNAARKGWPAVAASRDRAADLILRLYEGAEAFTAPNGRVYRYDPRHAMTYSLAISLVQVEFLDNGRERDTDLRSIVDNTGAMYYYTMVNVHHQHYFGSDRAKYDAWKGNLPKRVMRPEDWVLDPDFETAFRKRSGGWHDYGNEACSAALARYSNPRAQAMYRFVRDRIDTGRGSGPKRLRGVEFVK